MVLCAPYHNNYTINMVCITLTVNKQVHGHLHTSFAVTCQAFVFSLVPWIYCVHYNKSAFRESMLLAASFHHLIILSNAAIAFIYQTQWHLLSIL